MTENELKSKISKCNLITNFLQFKADIKELFEKYDIEFSDAELELDNIKNIPINDYRTYAYSRTGKLTIYGYTHQNIVQQRQKKTRRKNDSK